VILHVLLTVEEDGWIVAECPALPGCISQGKDQEEATENIREAIAAWLLAQDRKSLAELPPDQDREIVQVVV
jgi:predicted RNase H-like HicB family nuclease